MYIPLGGNWLNMVESVAAHWNTQPTPFIWAGKRKA
jgi:hypothetical protein